MPDSIHDYLAAIGRRGGQANTAKQNAARAANGKLGGRPRKKRRPAKRKVKRGASPNNSLSGPATASGVGYAGGVGSAKEVK